MDLHQYKPMLQEKGALVGRILLALLFLTSGVNMFLGGIGNTAMYFENMGIPLAGLVVIIVIAVKIVGSICLIIGYKVEEAAFALLIFTSLTSLIDHRDTTDLNLWKNLSIIGGMLYVMAYGAGTGWKYEPKRKSAPEALPTNTTNY